ncbi:hypothetical protein I3760_14G114000 [Carya illinoinensis]|nr:hypothetical protein I3760_14G114000 [Carya illinoinensis]
MKKLVPSSVDSEHSHLHLQISVFSIQASRYRRRTYCNCSVHIPCTTCCFLPCNVHIQLLFFPCCVINILLPFILNNIVKYPSSLRHTCTTCYIFYSVFW